jgi:hypothetical protein
MPAVASDFSYAHRSNRRISPSARELRLFLELLCICVTLACSALHIHQFGVAHQSSLRSSTTMMSFSISLCRQVGAIHHDSQAARNWPVM